MHIWRIHSRSPDLALPKVILTAKSGAVDSNLPPEVAALLPTRSDDDAWITQVPPDACVGLFMANPLQQRNRTDKALHAASVRWVANMPSVSQHDAEFVANLAEVGLGPRRELDNLARYQSEGVGTIAVIASPQDANYALSRGLTIMLVLPRIQAYEGGFPSELSRNRAVGDVADALGTAEVTLLSLVSSAEAAAQSVWPPQIKAVIERPGP